MIMTRRIGFFALLVVGLLSSLSLPARAQIIGGGNQVGAAPGVYVEPDGTVRRREIDEKTELSAMRLRAKFAADADKDPKLAYVSLPKAFAVAREAISAGKPVPNDVRFLGGLTQISFVFLYGDDKDLVIAGPAEPFKTFPGDDGYAVGTRTGRPVMRLEDFVVAMRVVQGARGNAFGCRLDPDPAAPQRISDAMAKMARASRSARVKAVQDATGPQKVSFFGAVPDDTRFALTTVAADYELKRYGLGLARHTVAGMGNIVDNTRQAVNMIWFELAYQPILVSADGDAFGLRGPRLKVQAGSFGWDPKGATPKAYEFAKKMSDNIDALGIQQPLIADLQNLADLSVVAALIQRDKLDRKVGWDTGWLMQSTGDSLSSFPVTKVVTPRNADALANYTNGSIAAGGVVLSPGKVLSSPTEPDDKKTLDSPKAKGADLRKQKQQAAVVGQ
ncbi:DUF1598 domain-containing protein [Humisphaera borealis]|uniref:DUF1598 domain-containing protein n=1 Tax=Humisphaera borealis TaxID=2807512 RepID=A0A7M2X2Y7_9BACT|nr:DUF1598 domain-containing protein [Humisphaera borealis]QOV91391.1 DUF1598 domain-containing protein [Humisphaera borealis]